MWETSWENLGNILGKPGKHPGKTWETSWENLGRVWETTWENLGRMWETTGEKPEKHTGLGRHLHAVGGENLLPSPGLTVRARNLLRI